MKRSKRSFIIVLLAVVLFFTTSINTPVVEAATFNDINKPSVFLKQKTNYTCTLVSNAMLVRRTLLACDKSSWSSVTESSMRKKVWGRSGIATNFTYASVKIRHKYINSNKKNEYIALLKKYPQGVVAYNNGRRGQYHAILLTDYDAKTDTFYCADPAPGTPKGRIPLSRSSIKGSSQSQKINNLSRCWYVASATPTLDKNSMDKIPATNIRLNVSKMTLKKGKTYQLKATLAPNKSIVKVIYSSSNSNVATVNSKGKITARKKGKAVITAKTSCGKKASCTVIVK